MAASFPSTIKANARSVASAIQTTPRHIRVNVASSPMSTTSYLAASATNPLKHMGTHSSSTFYQTAVKSQVIIRPRRSRSAAAYSHQTFPCTICRSVGRPVCLSSALWKNGRSQPAAVWHHRSDGSTDEAGIGVWQSVHGKGYFWRRIWTAPL